MENNFQIKKKIALFEQLLPETKEPGNFMH